MKKPLLIAVLAITLLLGGGALVAETAEISLDIQQQMEAVLASPEAILMSQPNVTTATQLLVALPEPETKIPIAVYAIRDNTGQLKADMGAASTVVTQGATEMLITALHRSRQFKILDRSNFADFINEQNLVVQNRVVSGQGPGLGQMTGARYLISGAITEYQVSKETGGIGLAIAGKGGSKEYAKATTAIDLRVTDTTTGEVVWAESFKGEIIGEQVGLQVFSFLGKNIVEFETGKGEQEVINLIIRTLLEEALFLLVQSGVLKP